MTKLVVCDMDGTLLHGDKSIPEKTFQMLDALEERGIEFLPVSGRGKRFLEHMFDRKLPLITDNGGAVYDREDKLLHLVGMTREQCKPVFDLVENTDYMELNLYSKDYSYVWNKAPRYFWDFINYQFLDSGALMGLDDLYEAFDRDTVIKLSVATGAGGAREEEGIALIRSVVEPPVSCVFGGDGCIDVYIDGTTKGSSLEIYLDHYKIAPEEVLAFGDYMNDYEMFELIPDSCCVSNAHPKIKEIAGRVLSRSNDEDAVLHELDERFDLGLY